MSSTSECFTCTLSTQLCYILENGRVELKKIYMYICAPTLIISSHMRMRFPNGNAISWWVLFSWLASCWKIIYSLVPLSLSLAIQVCTTSYFSAFFLPPPPPPPTFAVCYISKRRQKKMHPHTHTRVHICPKGCGGGGVGGDGNCK